VLCTPGTSAHSILLLCPGRPNDAPRSAKHSMSIFEWCLAFLAGQVDSSLEDRNSYPRSRTSMITMTQIAVSDSIK
jgi:hypothetical protein